MPHKSKIQRDLISVESAKHIAFVRASCEEARVHIDDSRNAVARSLGLLRRRFSRLYD